MNYEVRVISDPVAKSDACASMIRALPEWFGIEQANRQFISNAANASALAAYNTDARVVGLLVYRSYSEPAHVSSSLEIDFLGILPEFHFHGIGRRLITELEQIAAKGRVSCLTTETLDPAVGDSKYLQTFRFYASAGFTIYRRFSYDETNPMVRLKKHIS